MFVFMAVALASCGGDDKDEPNAPNGSSNVQTINLSEGFSHSVLKEGSVKIGLFSGNPNAVLEVKGINWTDPHIKYVGQVNSIKEITISTAGSITKTQEDAIDNGGYLIEYIFNGKPAYIRLIISLYKLSSGKVSGAEVKYQFI